MKLTAETQAAISKSLSAVFATTLSKKQKDYRQVALEVQANTMSVDYRWLAAMPAMREWIGERQLKDLEGYTYTITKKNWEATIKIDRDIIQYDSLGIAGAQVAGMADLVIDHYNQMVFNLFNTNGACYDGKAFFAGDHQVGQYKFSNLGNWGLDEGGILEARKNMRSLVSESGAPLNINPNLVLIHPNLEGQAMKMFKAPTKANGEIDILPIAKARGFWDHQSLPARRVLQLLLQEWMPPLYEYLYLRSNLYPKKSHKKGNEKTYLLGLNPL